MSPIEHSTLAKRVMHLPCKTGDMKRWGYVPPPSLTGVFSWIMVFVLLSALSFFARGNALYRPVCCHEWWSSFFSVRCLFLHEEMPSTLLITLLCHHHLWPVFRFYHCISSVVFALIFPASFWGFIYWSLSLHQKTKKLVSHCWAGTWVGNRVC